MIDISEDRQGQWEGEKARDMQQRSSCTGLEHTSVRPEPTVQYMWHAPGPLGQRAPHVCMFCTVLYMCTSFEKAFITLLTFIKILLRDNMARMNADL